MFSTQAGLYFEFLDITRGQSGFTEAQTLRSALRAGLRRTVRCAAACRVLVTVAGRRRDRPQESVSARVLRLSPEARPRSTARAGRSCARSSRPGRSGCWPGSRGSRFVVRAPDRERGRDPERRSRPVTLGDGWLFFQIELFGRAEVTSDLERNLSSRSAMTGRARPLLRERHRTTPSDSGPITSPNGRNGRDRAPQPARSRASPRPGRPPARRSIATPTAPSAVPAASTCRRPPDAAGNGYDLRPGAIRAGSTCARSTWRSPEWASETVQRPAMEFGFNYSKYNRENAGPDFTPQNLTYVELDSTRGLKDPQNYLWNDEYTLGEAGSPNPGESAAAGRGTSTSSTRSGWAASRLPSRSPSRSSWSTRPPTAARSAPATRSTFAITVTNQGEGVAREREDHRPAPARAHLDRQPAAVAGHLHDLFRGPAHRAPASATWLENQSRTVEVTARDVVRRSARSTTTPPGGPLPTTIPAVDDGSVTCQRPSLVVQKTPDGQTVTAGDPIAFAITVVNNGPGVARDVTLSDPLPPGPLWTITQQPLSGSCMIVSGTLTCAFGDLPGGDGSPGQGRRRHVPRPVRGLQQQRHRQRRQPSRRRRRRLDHVAPCCHRFRRIRQIRRIRRSRLTPLRPDPPDPPDPPVVVPPDPEEPESIIEKIQRETSRACGRASQLPSDRAKPRQRGRSQRQGVRPVAAGPRLRGHHERNDQRTTPVLQRPPPPPRRFKNFRGLHAHGAHGGGPHRHREHRDGDRRRRRATP